MQPIILSKIMSILSRIKTEITTIVYKIKKVATEGTLDLVVRSGVEPETSGL